MKRRTLVLRVGDHWFLRHVRDLYETLTSKYTTKGEKRGIVSVFPNDRPAPFLLRRGQASISGFNDFYKDKQSERAFTEPMDKDAELKIYVAGHSSAGGHSLSSLETSRPLQFHLEVQALAQRLHTVFQNTQVNATAANPIKISLIACQAASGSQENDASDSFAAQLLTELYIRGHDHILVKAREKNVSAPFFGKKYTNGNKEHFYLSDGVIYQVKKDDDLRKQVLKMFKDCQSRTKVAFKSQYLQSCIESINALGVSDKDQKIALKEIIDNAVANIAVKQYQYGTAWFMNLFGIKSRTEKHLRRMSTAIDTILKSEYQEISNLKLKDVPAKKTMTDEEIANEQKELKAARLAELKSHPLMKNALLESEKHVVPDAIKNKSISQRIAPHHQPGFWQNLSVTNVLKGVAVAGAVGLAARFMYGKFNNH